MNVIELWKARKVVSQSRGRAIFAALGIDDATPEQVESIADIDRLMTVKGIKDASEAVRRWQSGERATKTQQTNSNSTNNGNNYTAQNAKATQLQLVQRSAETKAAGLEITGNLLAAKYLTGEIAYSPEVQQKVDQSYQVLEAALYGINPDYDSDNLVTEIETQLPNVLGGINSNITALPTSKEIVSTNSSSNNSSGKNGKQS